MRSRICYILLVLSILLTNFAFAEEKTLIDTTPVTPDPTQLSMDWWRYFDNQDKDLDAHITEFIQSLKATTAHLTPLNQQQASLLITRIETMLHTYAGALKKPKPEQPQIPPLAETYSIDQLLQLFRTLQQGLIEQKTAQIQENNLVEHIARTDQYLTSLRTQYKDAEERSEKKYLIGLEIILYTTTDQVNQLNHEHLKAEKEILSSRIAQLKEAINAAQNRLVSSPTELQASEKAVKDSENNLEKARTLLQQSETEAATLSSDSENKDVHASNEIILAQLRQSTIKEGLARSQLILDRAKLELAVVLNNPDSVDVSKLDATLNEWKQELTAVQSSMDSWTEQTEQFLEQDSRILSLNTEEIKSNEEPLRKIISINQNTRLLLDELKSSLMAAKFLTGVVNTKMVQLVSPEKRWLWSIADAASYVYQNMFTILDKSLVRLGPDRSITIGSVIRFILTILLTLWVARLVRRGLHQFTQGRRGIQKSVAYRINRLISYCIISIGLLIALTGLGFDFSSLVLLASALGVGLGFGLQSIFNNFISGLIILFESQIQVGDYIELDEGGLRGEIREIRFRSTLVTTNDGTDVLIPNSEMISKRLINWTLREPYRRIHVPFSVAYGTDKELVEKIVLEAAKSVPNTLSRPGVPEPRVHVTAFGGSGLEFELTIWVDEPSSRRLQNTLSAYLWAIDTAFQKNGIVVPFPQQDIHVISDKESYEDKLKKT